MATKKGAKGAGGEKGGGRPGEETGFLFSFKLDGAKKKTRKQRKALIGIDASGQKTQEFDQIEGKLMSFLRQRQDDPASVTSNDPEHESSSTTTTTSTTTSSLLASFQSHPFGSGLFHLRAEEAATPTPPAHTSDAHVGPTPKRPPSPVPQVVHHPSQPLAHSGNNTTDPIVTTSSPSPPLPLPPYSSIPSLPPSLSSPSTFLSPAGECREAGLAAKEPRERGRRSRRSGQRNRRQHPDCIDVDADTETDTDTPTGAGLGMFGHSLLPPLACASFSASTPLPAAAGHGPVPTPTGWSTIPMATTAAAAAPSFHPLAAGPGQAGYARPGPLPSTQHLHRHPPQLDSRGFEPWSQPNAAAAGGDFPLAAPTQRQYDAHDRGFAGYSHAWHEQTQTQTQTQTQYHSESGEAYRWRRDHPQHRRRLDDEERSLLAEGRERVVRTLRELESGDSHGRSGHGKRRVEEIDLASSLRYKLQRLDTLSGRRMSIWTDDAHLSYFSATSECIRLYVVHSWPSCPLNPLALSEENLQRFLCRRSTEEERGTSLALNICVALALGAILLGDKARAFTYYREARQQLAYLFDSSDYSVAEALFGLTYIAFSKGSMKKAMYYTTLAMQICRQLNAFHSSVYNRCLMSLFFMPTTAVSEKKRLWNEYTEKIAVLPHYDEGRLLMFDVAEEEEGGNDAGERVQLQQQFVNMGHNKIRTTYSMRNNVRQAKVIDRVTRNCMAIYLTFHALDQKCEERKRQLPTAQQNVCLQDLFTDAEEMKSVYEVLNVLVGKCKLVEQLLINEKLPVSLKAGTEISIFALYGELNQRLGRAMDAINWAKRCLNTLIMHDAQFLPVGILSSLIMVINIFFCYRKHHRILQLLQALRPLANAYPSVQFLQKSYLARLKAVCAQERIDGLVFGDEDGEPRIAAAAATTSPPALQRDSRKSPVLPYPHPHSNESDGDESATHTASSAGSSQHGSPTTDDDLRHHATLHYQQQGRPHYVAPITAGPGSTSEAAMQPPLPAMTTTTAMTDASSWAAHHLNAQPNPAPNHPSRPSAHAATPAFLHQASYGGDGGPHTHTQVAGGSPPAWYQAMIVTPTNAGDAVSGVAGSGGGAGPGPRRERGSDFIAKLRRWVRDGGGGDNLQSVEDLVDDFAVFLEEVDV